MSALKWFCFAPTHFNVEGEILQFPTFGELDQLVAAVLFRR